MSGKKFQVPKPGDFVLLATKNTDSSMEIGANPIGEKIFPPGCLPLVNLSFLTISRRCLICTQEVTIRNIGNIEQAGRVVFQALWQC